MQQAVRCVFLRPRVILNFRSRYLEDLSLVSSWLRIIVVMSTMTATAVAMVVVMPSMQAVGML